MIIKLVEKMESHDVLNPTLWDGTHLKPEVRQKLYDIAAEYVANSEILKPEDIIDIEFLGSNANYNYHPNSDIDLHLVVNMSNLSSDPTLAQVANNLEKVQFNSRYDLGIKGIEVELYVEDVKAGTMSNGIYSIVDDDWIKEPQPVTLPDFDNDIEYNELLNKWRVEATNILSNPKDSNEVKEFIDRLYNLRRTSLMKDGEFAKGNYVFKQLRDDGILQQLRDKRYELSSKELSLENISK